MDTNRNRLNQQIDFVLELDRLKSVLRRSYLFDGSRRENSAEHSWHVALLALVLAEHAPEPVDASRVALLLLVHDIVEIDAGDTFIYDRAGNADKAARERQAADRLFGMLPPPQSADLRDLWEEYEHGDSPEARFARALDRLMPLLHNIHTEGRSWREHGINRAQVEGINRETVSSGSPALWELLEELLDRAVAVGHLAPAPTQ